MCLGYSLFPSFRVSRRTLSLCGNQRFHTLLWVYAVPKPLCTRSPPRASRRCCRLPFVASIPPNSHRRENRKSRWLKRADVWTCSTVPTGYIVPGLSSSRWSKPGLYRKKRERGWLTVLSDFDTSRLVLGVAQSIDVSPQCACLRGGRDEIDGFLLQMTRFSPLPSATAGSEGPRLNGAPACPKIRFFLGLGSCNNQKK
jgi:hypothetical protein